MRGRWAACVIALAVSMAGPSLAVVGWKLDDPDCIEDTGVIEILCGNYGVFHVGDTDPTTCEPIASGDDEPLVYPPPPSLDPFPHPSTQPSTLGLSGRGQPRASLRAKVAPGTPPPNLPWIAVIDFEGAHGDSTFWLSRQVAGAQVDTMLARLEDPALAGLGGEVNDFHVLARLCKIADLVDNGSRLAPLAVNMSFGRAVDNENDPTSADCEPSRISCQIARVIAYLRAKGTAFVAAAGNHREMLFPASLPDVASAGMLDVVQFLEDGTAHPAWETPEGAEGLVPGNALCLDTWGAPAGSSYASALLTGWLAKLLRNNPQLVVTGSEPWIPRWSEQQQCYVLARGTTTTSWCNPAVQETIAGLAGANAAKCWSLAATPSETVPLPGRAQSEPTLPSLVRFAAGEHPAPEADPCVPCTGTVQPGGGGGGQESLSLLSGDLVLDLSQTPPLPAGTHIDAVSLRIGASYYPLDLTATQIGALEDGGLSQLVLTDASSLAAVGEQISLWYRLKIAETADCGDPDACYWSSTPILLRGE